MRNKHVCGVHRFTHTQTIFILERCNGNMHFFSWNANFHIVTPTYQLELYCTNPRVVAVDKLFLNVNIEGECNNNAINLKMTGSMSVKDWIALLDKANFLAHLPCVNNYSKSPNYGRCSHFAARCQFWIGCPFHQLFKNYIFRSCRNGYIYHMDLSNPI